MERLCTIWLTYAILVLMAWKVLGEPSINFYRYLSRLVEDQANEINFLAPTHQVSPELLSIYKRGATYAPSGF